MLPVLPYDDRELQTMETMHTYTPVFTVKLLSGECSQDEVHKLTLNLCQHAVQTNHLTKRLWRTNQHKFSGRRYLDLKDWTHRVRSGDCGNRLARCIDLPGKASQCVTHSKTNTQRQLHMIKPKRTDRNTHTRQRELIYRMHTFHSQLYTRSNINKQTRCNAINLQTCINSHMQTSKSYKPQMHKHNDCMRTHTHAHVLLHRQIQTHTVLRPRKHKIS